MTEGRALDLVRGRATVLIVSLLTIALVTLANLPWQLEDYDQAKQAFTSWEMVKAGRLFYQETPIGKVATKPPLVGWVSALLYEATRSWDIAWRLPSVLAALALAWLLWRRASALFGAVAGVMALAAFSFNLLTPRLASLVRTDMPLALVLFAIALLFFEQIREARGWGRRERVWLFLLLTASMLIKGPIVYAFVLPALLLFRWRRAENARAIATGWWPWLLSLGIFIAWVAGGIRTVPGFYDEVVVREFAGRFGETIHRPQPLYFYWPHLLHKWGPWSLLLIGLLIAEFRATRLPPRTAAVTAETATPATGVARSAGRRWLAQWPPELFWLLAWSVGGLLVMSCIPSKRVDRIFPVIPPMCLLLAAMVSRALLTRETIARWCAATLLAAIFFSGSYSLFKIVYGISKHRDAVAKCARDFRVAATEQGLRYAAIHDENEALVMYLDLPSFVSGKEAVQRWNAGEIDAIVGSEERVRALMHGLEPVANLAPFCEGKKTEQRFAVLTRR